MRLQDAPVPVWRSRAILFPAIAAFGGYLLAMVVFGQLSGRREQQAPEQLHVSGVGGVGPVPEVSYLLGPGDWLGLNGEQRRSIQRLAREQKSRLDEVEKKLKSLTRKSTGSGQGAGAGSDQAVPQDMPELTRTMMKLREDYWDRATGLLTEGQRATVEARRRKDWKEALRRMGISTGEAGQ